VCVNVMHMCVGYERMKKRNEQNEKSRHGTRRLPRVRPHKTDAEVGPFRSRARAVVAQGFREDSIIICLFICVPCVPLVCIHAGSVEVLKCDSEEDEKKGIVTSSQLS